MRDDGAVSFRSWPPERCVVGFVVAVAVFHHLPIVAGAVELHDPVDLITPFAVAGAALATLLSLHAPPRALLAAFVGAILYVDGHGIHLAANSIGNEPVSGRARDLAHFWDEQFGHVWWHLGWLVLVAAICLAEPGQRVALSRRRTAAIVFLLGATLFTNTVEGGDWWLELAGTAVFCAWAATARRPLLVAFAGAFAFGAALIGIWAIWHGGEPQFSQLGWI
ncbi:MAG: hypothetical protein QOE95_204 [Gaiellaceae bacterium]|jgi:hypothetical protein|nr:hypothetical protein [Gaiellaceae bacterium]